MILSIHFNIPRCDLYDLCIAFCGSMLHQKHRGKTDNYTRRQRVPYLLDKEGIFMCKTETLDSHKRTRKNSKRYEIGRYSNSSSSCLCVNIVHTRQSCIHLYPRTQEMLHLCQRICQIYSSPYPISWRPHYCGMLSSYHRTRHGWGVKQA